MISTKRLKLLCLILTISMLALGMHCEEPLAASSFFYATDSHAASILRAPGGQLNSHIYNEGNKLSELGEFTLVRQTPRTVTVMRLSPLFIMALLLTGALELTAISFTTLSLNGSCQNQYRRRTLRYIHHKDGKKHQF